MSTDRIHTIGITVREFAKRYRVSPEKVRGWIRRGELKAINTADLMLGKPRWVITADQLAEFEKRRTGGPTEQPAPRRRRKPQQIDYYPD